MMVCDIRGWGKIQYMDKSEERQDAIGEKIAELLNQYGTEAYQYEIDESGHRLPQPQ